MSGLVADYSGSESEHEDAGEQSQGKVILATRSSSATAASASTTKPAASTATTTTSAAKAASAALAIAAAIPSITPTLLSSSLPLVSAAPTVLPKPGEGDQFIIDPYQKEVFFNPKIDQMYRPQVGPLEANKATIRSTPKNILTGFCEAGEVDSFHFETQRRTFQAFGYALDPSVTTTVTPESYVGDREAAVKSKGADVVTAIGVRAVDKRKRDINTDPADIDNYKGPWAKFSDEKRDLNPTEDQLTTMKEWKEIEEGNNPTKRLKQDAPQEKSLLHITDDEDYLGRSYLHPPQDLGVKFGEPPERCFLPKKCIHTWSGHTKGVSAIRFIPVTAHLLLSAGMDSKVKIWEVYGKRRCIRTYSGHSQAVRDISFSNDGKRFLTASYDRYVKLWDTETGQCISKFTNKKIPYCVKFHPDEDKQHLFVAGTQDKKIICFDVNSGEIVQEYDRHLGAVNTISFVGDNRRMVSTSDDKSIRIWEWDVPVDTKYISDPGMHSMPAAAIHPNKKWMIFQSMNNKIVTFDTSDKFRMNRKKEFKGHLCAGYACQVNFSPDGQYVISGDGNGHLCIWDWQTSKLYSKIKAHDEVCIGAEWNPHEPSRVATCGWDGLIKYWD